MTERRAALAVMVLGTLWSGQVQAESVFDPSASIATGLAIPEEAKTGDFDGDGDLDLAVAVFNDNDVIVYLNATGDASSWAAVTVDNSFAGAKNVTPADVDGDGDLDLFAAAVAGNEVTWYENTAGTGLLWTKRTIAACGGAYAAVAADLDGDGDLDVASVCATPSTVVWWANDGFGGTWTATTVEASFAAGSALTAGDVDGDGAIDLIGAAFTADAVSWFSNDDGDGGAWTTHAVATSYLGPLWTDVGDLDGDGDLDILAAAGDGGSLDWFENTNGIGTSWTAAAVDSSFAGAESIVPVDLDEDGDLDVLAAGNTTVSWYENSGGGATWTASPFSTSLTGAESVWAGDLDGDGDLDPIVLTSTASGGVQWYENVTIHHSSLIEAEVAVASVAQANGTAAGDIDGDGDADVVFSTTAGVVQWAENAGVGATFTVHPVDTGVGNAVEFALADVDSDGDLDIAGASLDTGVVRWWENAAGDGSSWVAATVVTGFTGANSVDFVDMDGDGDPDLVSAASSGDDVSWFENSLPSAVWIRHSFNDVLDGAADAVGGDLDGDGDSDVVAAAVVADDIVVYLFSSAGTANTATTIAASADAANSVALGDLDADGDLDIVAGLGGSSEVLWFANDGAGGTWTEHTVDGAFSGARAVDAVDFDGDGDVDLVAAAVGSGDLAWWENSGAAVPVWTKHTIDSGLTGAHGVSLADMDGDGSVDVVASGRIAGLVSWWANERAQASSATTDVATATPMPPGTSTAAVAINPIHLGRLGDNEAEVASLGLRLENGAGLALNTVQASAVFSDIHVYVDANGNDAFDAGTDIFIVSSGPPTLTAGAMEITLPDGNGDLDFGLATLASILVVPETTGTSGSALIPNVRVVHDPSVSLIEDDSFDAALTLREAPEVFALLPIDQPPTGHAGPATGAYSVVEGSPLTMDGSLSTDAEASVAQWAWDCDNDGSYETVAVTAGGATCTFVDDAVVTVGLEVTDTTGQTGTATGSVTVTNALPTISSVAPTTATEGVLYSYTATATDPGTADTFSWALTTTPTGMTVGATSAVVEWTAAYADVGANAVTVEVTDDDGGVATQSWTITVTAADVDGDGMADGWELDNGLDPTVDDSLLDPDADGVTNVDEFLGGTDPNAFDGPDVPVPVAPIAGVQVVTAVPALSWSNATDPQGDTLTYDVEVYDDASMTTLLDSLTGVAEDISGTTAGTVVTPLPENSDPFWRVRAADPNVAGTWSNLETFFVNAVNEAPGTPTLTTPIGGQSVGVLAPTLVLAEAVDPDRDALTYDVRLWDEGQVTVLGEGTGIVPAAGSAEWVVSIDLTEDMRYSWDARAVDASGLHGLWSAPETFFVNTENQAPGNVVFTEPTDGDVLEERDPTFACTETTDPEEESISYVFELSLSSAFDIVEESSAIEHTGTGEAAWSLADDTIELEENVTWYARVRAEDELGAASDWDGVSVFVRGDNDAPAVPVLVGPEDGADAAGAVYRAGHAVDPEADDVTYEFIIAADEDLTDPVEESGTVEPGAGPAGTADQTSWESSAVLGGAVFWSARAVDDRGATSDWAPARSLRAGRDVVLAEPGPDETSCRLSIAGAPPAGVWLLPLLVAIRRRR
jgi:hypothetical protein